MLQAVVDADYKFICIEVGGKGRQSDGGTFFYSKLHNLLMNDQFKAPSPQCLPGSNIRLPFVLIGDEAYPLKKFLLRPYPSTHLDNKKKEVSIRDYPEHE